MAMPRRDSLADDVGTTAYGAIAYVRQYEMLQWYLVNNLITARSWECATGVFS